MTNFDKLKTMSVDELAEWLDKYSSDITPWTDWFDDKFCSNCECVMKYVPACNKEMKHSFCEVNGYCRFFEDTRYTPYSMDIVKMWLEADSE